MPGDVVVKITIRGPSSQRDETVLPSLACIFIQAHRTSPDILCPKQQAVVDWARINLIDSPYTYDRIDSTRLDST